jgi:hypothetical protein
MKNHVYGDLCLLRETSLLLIKTKSFVRFGHIQLFLGLSVVAHPLHKKLHNFYLVLVSHGHPLE